MDQYVHRIIYYQYHSTILDAVSLSVHQMLRIRYNKKVWSFPFTLVTAAVDGIVLTVCYYIIDTVEWKERSIMEKVWQPLVWLGMNSLFVSCDQIFDYDADICCHGSSGDCAIGFCKSSTRQTKSVTVDVDIQNLLF